MMVKLNEKINYNTLLFLLQSPQPLLIHSKEKIVGLAKIDTLLIDYDNGIIIVKQNGTKITIKVDQNDYVKEVAVESD